MLQLQTSRCECGRNSYACDKSQVVFINYFPFHNPMRISYFLHCFTEFFYQHLISFFTVTIFSFFIDIVFIHRL